jgi:hypothetical protein
VARKQLARPAVEATPEPDPAEPGPVAPMPSSNGHHDGRRLLEALKTLKRGDFSVRLSVEESVVEAAIAEAFNDVADLLEYGTKEAARIANVVGKEGRITHRANVGAATGAWSDRIDAMNTLIGDLVRPTEEVARVIGAVAKGDLSQRIPLEHDGSPLKGNSSGSARPSTRWSTSWDRSPAK